jgi:hypothetical protein
LISLLLGGEQGPRKTKTRRSGVLQVRDGC